MDVTNAPHLREDPSVWAVQTSKLSDYCSFCVRSTCNDGKLLRCAKCRRMYYCSVDCQRSDWDDHKKECKMMIALNATADILAKSPEYPDDFLRVFTRIVSRYRGKQKKTFIESNGRDFDRDLMTHKDLVDKLQFAEFFKLFTHFAIGLLVNDDDTELPTTLFRYYCKLRINAFGIKNGALQSVGLGLYLSLSRLDHSCDPNARILFFGKMAVVVPTRVQRFADTVRLESLQHSYIDNLESREIRRRMLKTEYCFDCDCNGCRDDFRNRELSGTVCQAENCATLMPCSVVGHESQTDDLSTVEMARQACTGVLTAVEHAGNIDNEKLLEMCAKTAMIVEGVFYAYNVDRMKIYRLAQQACVKLEKWSNAAKYGTELVRIYRHYYGDFDPWLLQAELNYGRTLTNANDSKRAVDIFAQCRPKLAQLYGDTSPFLLEVMHLLKRLQRK